MTDWYSNFQCNKNSVSVRPRRFYLTGDMTNLYPFIEGSLEWPFSELFSANVLLWNQYKYIAFNIFSCKILIVFNKMLIITKTFNKKTNELIMYGIAGTSFSVSIERIIESVQEFKIKLFELLFYCNMMFCIFEIMSICWNIIQWKYLKIDLIISHAQIKSVYKFSDFRLH